MNVAEAIKNRRSIRAYKEEPVPKEILDEILEAGRLAPSACNQQDWKFVMVTSPEVLPKVAEAMPQAHGKKCTAIAVLCGLRESKLMNSGHPRNTTDLSIAATMMHLRATDLGVGCCWMGNFNPEIVREAIHIPDDMEAIILLTLGWPAEEPKARHRKSWDEVVCYDTFQEK